MRTLRPSSAALVQSSWSLLLMALVTSLFLGRIASKDPRKFGYLNPKHNYVNEGFLEEKLVH